VTKSSGRVGRLFGFVLKTAARVRALFVERKFARYTLLVFNLILVVGITTFVVRGEPESIYNNTSSASDTVNAAQDPLYQISSVDVAVNLAILTAAPETTAIINQADSANAELLVPPTDTVAIAKPQTLATALKSRKDIVTYTVAPGDTIASIAAKFGVTSDSVLWSNGLSSGASVDAGKKLYVPPVNGLVYTVKSGDTPDTLANKYKASKEQIIIDNDAEVAGISVGEIILIRGGQQPAPTPVYTAWTYSTAGFTPTYSSGGYNGYDYGYCTWYAANRSGAPSNWGNANTWDNYAPLSGWTVSSVPRPGAIGQTDRGYFGHVAIVEEVSADGTQMKYSDMNGLAGWGRVGYSGWVSSSYYPHYIYR
jgi:surface antigen